jgi:hypothetical protein
MEEVASFAQSLKDRPAGRVFLVSLLPLFPAGALLWLIGPEIFRSGLKWIFLGMMLMHSILFITCCAEYLSMRNRKPKGKLIPFPESRIPGKKESEKANGRKRSVRPQRSILKEAVDF